MKTTEEVALQILLLCQVGIGIAANILLFVHNFSPVFTGLQLRPKQVIVTNLAIANVFILLLIWFPNNMTVLGPRKPPTDLKCKTEYFIHLVARSTNMCSTCALSTYQFFTLAPSNCGGLFLRKRSPRVLSYYSSYSCWLFSVFYNVYIPMKVTGPQNTGNATDSSRSKWVCSTSDFTVGMVYLGSVHDIMFISVMVWTCVSMVLLLQRHRQRLQCILSHAQEQRCYPETRAAHTILMLVFTFVSFYLLHCVCNLCHISFVDFRLWLRRTSEVLAAGFPTISPLLLIIRGPRDPCSVLFGC